MLKLRLGGQNFFNGNVLELQCRREDERSNNNVDVFGKVTSLAPGSYGFYPIVTTFQCTGFYTRLKFKRSKRAEMNTVEHHPNSVPSGTSIDFGSAKNAGASRPAFVVLKHYLRSLNFDLKWLVALVSLISIGLFAPVQAQENPFKGQWTLDTKASILSFQTVKNNAVVENSKFASFTGTIDEKGLATLKVQLDSVDTTIDLRNVRMRFLFFETFNFPEATITTQLDPSRLEELRTNRQIPYKLKFEMELHGIKTVLESDTIVTLISDGRVGISSSVPVPIAVKLFGMEENVRKLEDAAKVKILPSGSVSFNLVFANGEGAAQALASVAPKSTAVETKGNFSADACLGRFEILSRTGAIYFATGSATVEADSTPFLQAVSDIAQRCPELRIMISGHTDSDGNAAANQALSESRAAAVMRRLTNIGIDAGRLRSVGFGETRPVVANDTPRNRGLNRRIEFSVFDG